MGANTSKASDHEHHASHSTQHKVKDLVDFGPVLPNGLYPTALQDYDLRCVRNLILARKLAPFYKGLPEPPEVVVPTFTRPTLLEPPVPAASSSMSTVSSSTRRAESHGGRPRSASSSSCNSNKKQQQQHTTKPASERQLRLERMRLQREMLYNNAIECPICFLYYPANINYSRCCDQPLCTECFVQIKRPTETPNTPATCPFCMQENFGIIYHPPAWSEKSRTGQTEPTTLVQEGTRHTTSGVSAAESKPRRATLSHRDPSVVLVDHVRPNWHRAQATSATSSNSRRSSTLLRTVPTGYNHQHGPRSNRSASSATASEYNHFLSTMRGMDMDLEEWMVMEAIRRSLAEQENMTSVAQDADDNEPLYATARRLGYQQQQQQQQAIGSTESSSTSDASSDENDPAVYIDHHAENDKRVTVDPSNNSSNGNSSNTGNSSSGNSAGVVC